LPAEYAAKPSDDPEGERERLYVPQRMPILRLTLV